jgi:DNA processing protein
LSSEAAIRLSDDQLIAWLRLIRTDGVGPRTFVSLLNHYGGAAEAIRALPDLSRRRAGKAVTIVSEAEAERELTATRRFGARFVARGEPEYPKALAAIDSAPPLISVIGPLNLAALPLVSIVGSRNASVAGLKMTDRLSADLGSEGFGVVSGLARGIDTRAHLASLPFGAIAVVAGGLDKLYPEENRPLFEQLCDRGAVISEMPFGWVARGRDFPRRNRIVSGLALGTVVIEAAMKSGSLITARFANEQGREVFAVPGSPLDPRAEGPNGLIRQGATLVRSVADIVEVLRPLLSRGPEQLKLLESDGGHREQPLWDEADWLGEAGPAAKGPTEMPFDGWAEAPAISPIDRILSLLTATPIDPDDLARSANLPIREVNLALYSLEAEQRLDRHPGGKVSARVAGA